MSSITLTLLMQTVRERCDMLGDTDFLPDDQLTRMINAEAAELHDLVVSRFEEDFTVPVLATIASGNTISLTNTSIFPTTQPFYKLRGVDWADGTGQYHEVNKFDWIDRNRRYRDYLWIRARDLRYRLVGQTIYFTPDDGAIGSYRIWYIYGFVDLASPGDTLQYPENWHEYVISGCCARALVKEESDASAHLKEKQALKDRIQAAAATRDAGRRGRIQRVRRSPLDDRDWDF